MGLDMARLPSGTCVRGRLWWDPQPIPAENSVLRQFFTFNFLRFNCREELQ